MVDTISLMPSHRRTLLSLAISCLALIAHGASKPNILVFLVDDFGARDLSSYGSEFYETPAMDGLAAEGQRYTNAYSAHPRCVPSRYSFFTGRFPARDGCPGGTYNIAPERITFAEALKGAGYATFFAGKWHLAKTEDQMPDAQGFEINIAGGSAGAPRSYFAPYNKSKNPHHKAEAMRGMDDAPKGEFLTERLTDETIQFLKAHKDTAPDQPFLAVLAHYAVHTPLEAKEDDINYYKSKLGEPGEEVFIPRDGSTKAEQDNPTYAAMIKSVDDSLRRILETLDELELKENTLILLTSDHGGLSNRGAKNNRQVATSNLPYRAGKGHLYEGGIRVPFIVSWPGVTKPNTVSDALVTGTDVYATLLEAAGLPPLPDEATDSVSIMPAINGEALERGEILWHSPRPRPNSTGDTASSALRSGEYKIIKFYFPEVHYELYHLPTDIGENRDLSKERPKLTDTLASRLDSMLAELSALEPQPGR
jgi:arylsulfatase A-like enzyme